MLNTRSALSSLVLSTLLRADTGKGGSSGPQLEAAGERWSACGVWRALGNPVFNEVELRRIRRLHATSFVVLVAVACLSAIALWETDRWLSLSWVYQCIVAFTGFAMVLRQPLERVICTAQVTISLLVLGFFYRVAHTVSSGSDANLHSLTAPLFAGAIVVHTVFFGDAARRATQVLAVAATLTVLVAYASSHMHDTMHALGVARFVLCAFAVTILMEFVANLQRQQLQLKSDLGTMENLALTDMVTALPNRRAGDTLLHLELARARRHGETPSVLLIDVDNFKSINDRLGHHAGDAVLARVARVLREELRASDPACRWAGDEFLVILPATPLEGAITVAERVRKAVSRGASAGYEGATISIGIAVCDAGSDDVRSLVRRADDGLYRAKALGRNCVAAGAASGSHVQTSETAHRCDLETN